MFDGREILQRDDARFGREDLAAVIGRREIGQAAHEHALRLAALTVDLHARNARGGFGRVESGSLPMSSATTESTICARVAPDVLRRLKAAAKAGDDDRFVATGPAGVGCGLRRTRIRRGTRLCLLDRRRRAGPCASAGEAASARMVSDAEPRTSVLTRMFFASPGIRRPSRGTRNGDDIIQTRAARQHIYKIYLKCGFADPIQ